MTPAEAFGKWRKLAYGIANNYIRRLPAQIPREDIELAALGGLWDTALRHSSVSDEVFRRQAQVRIRGAIVDELRRQDWFSRRAREQGGGELKMLSTEAFARVDCLAGFSVQEDESAGDDQRRWNWVKLALLRLPRAHQRVVRRVLGGETQREIAEDLGLTQARISQIMASAVSALRNMHEQLPPDRQLG